MGDHTRLGWFGRARFGRFWEGARLGGFRMSWDLCEVGPTLKTKILWSLGCKLSEG